MSNQVVSESGKLIITEELIQRFEINSEENLFLDMEIRQEQEATIYLIYKSIKEEIQLNIQIGKNAEVTIFNWNETDTTLKIQEEVHFGENSKANMIYGELGLSEVKRKSVYHLEARHVELNTCVAAIGNQKKDLVFHAIHEETDTKSDMKNYAIIQENATFYLDVTGKIEKGAHRSNAQQVNRILTLADNHHATVLPQLLIDDNDVVAGHAMTMGQVDENQLYYMESRGIARAEAIQLLTLGYLTPIAYLLKEEQRQEVITMIEEKVSSQCLISKK